MTGPCCSPSHDDGHLATPEGSAAGTSGVAPGRADWVRLDGGSFNMGSPRDRYPGDGEAPVRSVDVRAFSIAANTVSNDDWARFVAATDHRSTAERYGSSFVFGGLLPDDFPPTQAVAAAPWWRLVPGACWSHPEGPGSDLEGRGAHPVVHVSWTDADAYCRWSGTSLPTEPQWEFAARGGLDGAVFPWGDELCPSGEHRMNVFQGTFPSENTGADGHLGTAPTDEYEPNAYGLHNVCGNVWEWCADRFTPGDSRRAMRGGSYLCHESYCARYRVAARSSNTPESSSGNIGFRVIEETPQTR